MKYFRQGERRARFQAVFSQMPRLEIWTETREVDGELRQIGNFQKISRSKQREMARIRAKREYRVEHGLPEIVKESQ